GWQGPLGLQRILTRCLEKAPERRFQSASDLGFAIEALSGTATSPSVAVPAIAWSLRPGPRPVATFQRLLYERASIGRGRFASDGKTVVYHGVLSDGL